MGTAVRPAKTSPGPWDAFADIDVFVDAVRTEPAAMARHGTRPQRSGPKPPLAGAALRKAVMAIRCVCFCGMQWRAIGQLCDIPFGTLYGLFARSGPGSASGADCSTGCAAPGASPAVMPRNRAPWSSTVAPVARRRVALSAASMAARRSAASRFTWPLRNTASPWRSTSRRRTAMTRKPSSRFCVNLPMAAFGGPPWAISATGASG